MSPLATATAAKVRSSAIRCRHDHRDPHLQGAADDPHRAARLLGLSAGSRLQASIDRHGHLNLVPALHEPEALFRDRPAVNRGMSIEAMDQAIAAAAGRADA